MKQSFWLLTLNAPSSSLGGEKALVLYPTLRGATLACLVTILAVSGTARLFAGHGMA